MLRTATAAQPAAPTRTGAWLWFGALLALTLIAYIPSWHGGPLWDDDAHLTSAALRGTSGLWRIWSTLGATQQYYPLVHSTFWILDALWGTANTLPYHLLNISLHATSAYLLLRILTKLEIAGAPLAAMVFALHPVHVESVAWITELKNTLSGVLYFAAALSYLEFDRSRNWRRYALALMLFILGLLSKTVVATLAPALLVVLWWQRGRISLRNDVVRLSPFFVVGVVAGLGTAWVERHFIGATGATFELSLFERCLLAGRAVWFYLGKLVWPADLIFIYPRWTISAGDPLLYVSLAALIALLAALWFLRGRARAPLATALLFIGTLTPALGFVNVFPFRYSYVADHFQYLASVAPIVLASAAITRLFARRRWPPQIAFGLAVPLSMMTWQQSAHYESAETLYQATLARNPGCWMCHNNLVLELLDEGGDLDAALAHTNESLRLMPNEEAFSNRGVILRRMGRKAEALPDLEEAVRLSPDFINARRNLGAALREAGDYQRALDQYEHLLRLNPNSAADLEDAGGILLSAGRLDEAINRLERALQIDPSLSIARNNLGTAYSRMGQAPRALPLFEEAVRQNPRDLTARSNLAAALAELGRPADAIRQYEAALAITPTAKTHDDLAYLLLRSGRRNEAATHLEQALALDPTYAPAHVNVGNLLVDAGRPQNAIAHYREALRDPSAIDAAQVHSNLGVALALAGDRAGAIAEFEKALAIRPDFAEARRNLERARR